MDVRVQSVRLSSCGDSSANDTKGGDKDSAPNRATASPLNVMVVGDSLSQGREGDWTWRYRIWQWFRDSDIDMRFAGPYTGTFLEPDGHGQGDDHETGGGYARGVADAFLSNSNHYSLWGRAAAVTKREIQDVLRKHPADLALVMLGFNDMGWFYSDWKGTLESIRQLVDNARKANPRLKFAVANVPHRSLLEGREDLVRNTDIYNSRLPEALADKATSHSPVHVVDVATYYDCSADGCPAGYDGLHPNALGEYQIAHAFSRTLVRNMNLGSKPLQVPTCQGRS
ncbi:Fibronectin type III domain [Geosmithia morbida]|uniref:Fibronectin type III domain n=1 Tax=Geosmithia morbida TaxID=1094350 RepID=A0A9P4YW94_9HYPO|nr:Fibronectin type III domain [Geosmithia morbida]KAF4122962.1 Fibronectin type III domain [Geosmithia morbida]